MTVFLPQQNSAHINDPSNSKKELYPTLYLLHGMAGDHSSWSRNTLIESFAAERDLAVVMPQFDLSFYTDMAYGNKYWTFLTEELPRIARSFFPLSSAREDNFVAGFSMGGYGAMKWALRHPDQFAAAASISGVLDITAPIARETMDSQYELIFGDQEIKGTDNDLLYLLDEVNKSDMPKPILYQCCGTADFLYTNNLTFRHACEQTSFQLTYNELPKAGHDWTYSNAKIKDIVAWLPIPKRSS